MQQTGIGSGFKYSCAGSALIRKRRILCGSFRAQENLFPGLGRGASSSGAVYQPQ